MLVALHRAAKQQRQRHRRLVVDRPNAGVAPIQRVLIVAQRVGKFPAVAEVNLVLRRSGVHLRIAVIHRIGVQCAVIRIACDIHGSAAVAGHAKIDGAILLLVVELQQQALVAIFPQDAGREILATQVAIRAIAARILQRAIDVQCQRVRQLAVQREVAALEAVAAGSYAHLAAIGKARLLGDHVDQPTRRAPTIQGGSRPLDDLDALNVVEVAKVLRIVAHAVEQDVVQRGKAANDERIALAVARSEADGGNGLHHVRQAVGSLIAHHFLGHDLHRLRNVAQRGINFGGGGGFCGCVMRTMFASRLHVYFGQRLRPQLNAGQRGNSQRDNAQGKAGAGMHGESS